MNKGITIENEILLKGTWLRVNIPYKIMRKCSASIMDSQGALLRKLHLIEGSNVIDVSNIHCTTINLKIETPFETILKEVKLNQL